MRRSLSSMAFVCSIAWSACGEGSDGAAAPFTSMYWSGGFDDRNGIRRAGLDGSGSEVLVSGADALSLAIDTMGGKLYWTTGLSGGSVQRSNLDGSDVEEIVDGLVTPLGLAIDSSMGMLYVSELGGATGQTGKIRRGPIDGTNLEEIAVGLRAPTGIGLDTRRGRIYWIERAADGEGAVLKRSDLDGSRAEEIVDGFDRSEASIAVDPEGGKVYWTTGDGVRRANLDGSDVESVVSGVGLSGIALDVSAGKVYWTSFTDKTVMRANLDGGGSELLVTDNEVLHSIVLAPEPPDDTAAQGFLQSCSADPCS